MGLYDNLRCAMPLPIEGANERTYQTKDTPSQFCTLYEIREDGSLWEQTYDESEIECGWEPVKMTGELRFYDFHYCDHLDSSADRGWIEWSAYLENGKVVRLNLIENRTE